MKFLVGVQARTGSSRLPGKVLLPLGHSTVLGVQMERLRRCREIDQLLVLTTTDPSDDILADYARSLGYGVFRGHPTDLLARHRDALRTTGAAAIAKIPSDCPLIDPQVVDRVLSQARRAWGQWDLATNLRPPTYPDGMDVEVMTAEALEMAYLEATLPQEREHTTPFFWRIPGRFRVLNVPWERGDNLSDHVRLTLDYAEDYALIREIVQHFNGQPFDLEAILQLMADRPELARINQRHLGEFWYTRHPLPKEALHVHRS